MKVIKLIYLFVLTLFFQAVFSQNDDIVKSLYWQIDKSVEDRLDNTDISKALKIQFEIPKNYEFERQIIKGTKDRTSTKDKLGYIHERYKQYYNGIKIENSDIRVHYLDGSFVSANGEYIDAPYVDTSIMISQEDAIAKAKEYIGAEKYIWEYDEENDWLKNILDKSDTSYPKPELVICRNNIDMRDTIFYVAYKMDIYATRPLSRDYIFVDAKTGNVVAVNPILMSVIGTADTRYSGQRDISTTYDQNSDLYLLIDDSRDCNDPYHEHGIKTVKPGYFPFTDDDNNWTAIEYDNTNKDNGALDAHWGAMMTYDYFFNVHGRDSYDNNGARIVNIVYVDFIRNGFADDNDNALWNGSHVLYGAGTLFDSMTALDVVAHEIGHGVAQYSVDLGVSALNEGLSDIWAVCVQNYAAPNKQIWLMGDEVAPSPFRNISNPHLSDPPQPDTRGEPFYWLSGPYPEPHINSGVVSHWFYILSVGKSGTNGIGNAYDVTGIGISKAEQIVYRALTVYMTSASLDWARTYTIQAAVDLYGACSPEVASVSNAWSAVGVGNSFVQVYFTNQTVNSNITITSCGDINVQNVTVTNNATLTLEAAGDINVQYATVNNNSKLTLEAAGDINVQDVLVYYSSTLILDAAGEVNIISDFEVDLGSELEIK